MLTVAIYSRSISPSQLDKLEVFRKHAEQFDEAVFGFFFQWCLRKTWPNI